MLTKKKTFNHAKYHVRQILSECDQHVPAEIANTPPAWTRPNNATSITEESSDGDDSYMTTSARTFASIVTEADRANEKSPPVMVVDMTKVKQDEIATSESMTASEVQIQILSEQNQKLMEQIESLSALVASLLNREKNTAQTTSSTTPDMQTITAKTDQYNTNQSNVDRITALENTFNQAQRESKSQMEELKSMLRQSLAHNKRTESEASDASGLGPATKRVDSKTTPKKSPSLAKADIRQNP